MMFFFISMDWQALTWQTASMDPSSRILEDPWLRDPQRPKRPHAWWDLLRQNDCTGIKLLLLSSFSGTWSMPEFSWFCVDCVSTNSLYPLNSTVSISMFHYSELILCMSDIINQDSYQPLHQWSILTRLCSVRTLTIRSAGKHWK